MQHLWHFINLTLLCTQPSTPNMYIYLLVYTGLYWILKYKLLLSAQVVWSEWGRSDTEGRDAGCGPGCKLIFKTPCHGIVNLHVLFLLLFSKDRWVTCNFFNNLRSIHMAESVKQNKTARGVQWQTMVSVSVLCNFGHRILRTSRLEGYTWRPFKKDNIANKGIEYIQRESLAKTSSIKMIKVLICEI